ncbi:MAG: glycosyltransferase [Solirubrobacterales bacterium]
MKIALVTPYSWTYPGGVNTHVEALADELLRRGDELHVHAPWDPPDARSARLHRGASPVERDRADHVHPLGRTVGFPANGAVSNLSVFPDSIAELRRRLRTGGYDVIHVHEPIAPMLGWDAALLDTGTPVVGTFHAFSDKAAPNHIGSLLGARRVCNRLSARIAVSEAAAWTGRRWFGGAYRVIPNGVHLGPPPTAPAASEELRVLFVGRAEERKGLPVLLSAFAATSEHLPARLDIVGAESQDVYPGLPDPSLASRIHAHGRVDDARLRTMLAEADVLCAPSLGGESFGMVLTEAFAAGTPVIASRIAGYTDVVSDGVDGVLVTPGDPQVLAEELRDLWHEPHRRRRMAVQARRSAQRFAWPRVADQVAGVYEEVAAAPAPSGTRSMLQGTGFVPADGQRVARTTEPPPGPDAPDPAPRTGRRRIGLLAGGLAAGGLAVAAAGRIDGDAVLSSFVGSSPQWVLAGFALMIASMLMRAVAWHAIARTALPQMTVRMRDVASGTMVGVFMSATLPARLGEPARALALARRLGRVRESFPVLVGTLVSQTVLNIVALVLLGVLIVATTDLFHRSQEAIFLVSTAPLLLLLAVLAAPMLARGTGQGRIGRVVVSARRNLLRVRQGLEVFRHPRLGSVAVVAQLGAWAVQLAAFWVLLHALGLSGVAGVGAAAASLFAVNVTAVVPATPSNVGVFQVAIISVLTTGYGVAVADALAYGIVVQAVEVATAVGLGVPALLREGVSWTDMRARAMQAAPVRIAPTPGGRGEGAEA